MSPSGVRREKAALSSGCKSHPANDAPRFCPQKNRLRSSLAIACNRRSFMERARIGSNLSFHINLALTIMNENFPVIFQVFENYLATICTKETLAGLAEANTVGLGDADYSTFSKANGRNVK